MQVNFVWKDCYSVGDDSFDDEHHEIVEAVNDLYGAIEEDMDTSIMFPLIDRLSDKVLNHFEHEEQFMQECFYPGYLDHKAHHDYIRNVLTQLQKNFNITLARFLICYCIDWWVVHILSQDKKYMPYLQQTVFEAELR